MVKNEMRIFFWWYDGWGDDDEIWLMRWMIHEMEMRNDKMEDARMDAWNRLMMVKYDAMIWWGRMMPWTYPQTLSLLIFMYNIIIFISYSKIIWIIDHHLIAKHPIIPTCDSIRSNWGLKPLVACHGMSVTTVEGVGTERKCVHQVQKRIATWWQHDSFFLFCLTRFVMEIRMIWNVTFIVSFPKNFTPS